MLPRKADNEFIDSVVNAINEQQKTYNDDDYWMVVAPGPISGYLSVLRNEVILRTNPSVLRREYIEYPNGLRIEFRTDEQARNSSRGRRLDKLFLHDDVSYRTYVALVPSLAA